MCRGKAFYRIKKLIGGKKTDHGEESYEIKMLLGQRQLIGQNVREYTVRLAWQWVLVDPDGRLGG